jgi:hypothetical protein
MRKLFFLTTLCTLALTSNAVFGADSVSQATIMEETAEALREIENPPTFGLNGHYLQGAPAEFKNGSVSGQKMGYREAHASLFTLLLPNCTETFALAVDYGQLGLLWEQNPYFGQSCFNSLEVGFLATTSRLTNWFLQAGFSDRFDPSHNFMAPYSRYSAQVWGRYASSEKLGWHIGALTQFGLKKINLWPIVGIDYTPSEHWKIRLVYPTDIAVVCSFDRHWSLALAGRFFNSRYRASKGEPLASGIFQYRNVGSELVLHYHWQALFVKAFFGSSWHGMLQILKSNGNQAAEYDLRPAVYGGIDFSLFF